MMNANLVRDLIDLPVRRMTVAAGRETIGFITEYRKRRFAAELVSGQRIGGFYPSSADAAQALSNARNADKGGK
jgi:hypothetical protein